MTYEKQRILTHDMNPDGGTDYETEYPFMVGSVTALEWKEKDGRGIERHYLLPAYSADPEFSESKGRCWHHEWIYEATERGNLSRGHGAKLMPFIDGVNRFLEQDVFTFPLPEAE